MAKSALQKLVEDVSIPVYDEVEELMVSTESIDLPDLGTLTFTFENLVKAKMETKAKIELLEKKDRAFSDALLSFMIRAEQTKVHLWDGKKFEVREGRSASKLDSTRLLEKGVPLETIQYATVDGKPYQYVQITNPPKPKDPNV